MQILTRQAENATILDVVGNIDVHNSPEMRKALLENLKRTARLIVNLEKVPYIDTSGVASLVEGLKESRSLKNRLIVTGLSPMARRVFELTQLTSVFEIYENEEQALKA